MMEFEIPNEGSERPRYVLSASKSPNLETVAVSPRKCSDPPASCRFTLGTAYHLYMARHLADKVQKHLAKVYSLTSNNCLTPFSIFLHRNVPGPRPVEIHAPASSDQLDNIIDELDRSISWKQLEVEEFNALWDSEAPKVTTAWNSVSLSENLYF